MFLAAVWSCVCVCVCLLLAAPWITSIEPEQLPTTGGSITITGANFGDDIANVSVMLVRLAMCMEVAVEEVVQPHHTLRVTVPPMPPHVLTGEQFDVCVTIGGVRCKTGARLTFSALLPTQSSA
jgi:hypothetical protein